MVQERRGQMCVDVELLMHVFEAQMLYSCGFWFTEGVRGQMFVDAHFFMHILTPKFYIFMGFGYLKP